MDVIPGSTAVLVPHRPDCPHRQAAWEWIRPRYEALGWEIVACDNEGTWSKARALGEGIQRVSGEYVVVADGDSWCDGLHRALEELRDGAPWCVPHRRVHRLTRKATRRVLAGERELNPALSTLHGRTYVGRAGGGMAVVRREALLEVPWDSRFVTWGGADVCWARALKTIIGHPWRGDAPLYHLHHPPERIGTPNQPLCDRYKAAVGDPEAMRALIEEAQ